MTGKVGRIGSAKISIVIDSDLHPFIETFRWGALGIHAHPQNRKVHRVNNVRKFKPKHLLRAFSGLTHPKHI